MTEDQKVFSDDRYERITDAIDQGSQTAQMFLDIDLKKQLGKSAPESHPDFNGTDCVECCEAIPAGRLALHRVRCVSCQQDLDDRNKLRRV